MLKWVMIEYCKWDYPIKFTSKYKKVYMDDME